MAVILPPTKLKTIWRSKDIENIIQEHTVAIWTFTFHKISGFVRVVLRPISIKPTGQDYEYFYLKIHIYYSHFPSISCRSCQIHCFLHTVDAIPKRLNHLSHIFASNCNSSISTKYQMAPGIGAHHPCE